MAMRYRQSVLGGEREELEQVARLAMVEACSTFDTKRWKRGKDGLERLFAKHAVWRIRHALAEYVRSLANPVRLPGVIMDKLPLLRREQCRLANALQREPTVEELAKAVGMPNGKYQCNSVAMIAAMLEYERSPIALNETRYKQERGPATMHNPAQNAMLIESFPSPNPTPEEALLAKEERRELMRQRIIG